MCRRINSLRHEQVSLALTLRSELDSEPILAQGEVDITTRSYEVLYIVDPTLTDEQVEGIVAKYSTIVTDQGGVVKAAGKWDKRRLAYEIKHRREGIYILMFFDGEPAVAKELDRVMRIADDVIRYIITRVEPKHVDTTRIEQPQPPIESLEESAEEEVSIEEESVETSEETSEEAVDQHAAEEVAEATADEEETETSEQDNESVDEPAETDDELKDE